MGSSRSSCQSSSLILMMENVLGFQFFETKVLLSLVLANLIVTKHNQLISSNAVFQSPREIRCAEKQLHSLAELDELPGKCLQLFIH